MTCCPDPSPWTPQHRALWSRVAAHAFQNPAIDLDFAHRLARDRSWTLAYTLAAIEEYRRFCFLAVVSPTPVTPSEEVDEVWHQHLLYSRDYWDGWCGVALGRSLHHDPTPGGRQAALTYRAQYASTLALYETYFGPPPEAFWPASHRRFRAPRFRTIDRDRALVIPRATFGLRRARLLIAGLLACLPGAARAQTLNPLDWSGTPFLELMAVLSAVSLVVAFNKREAIRSEGGDQRTGRPLDAIETAFLVGGAARAADAAIVERFDTPLADAVPVLRGERKEAAWRRDEVARLQYRLAGVHASLVDRGLVPSEERCGRIRVAVLKALSPVMLLGLVKLAVGLSRDRPVGFLVILLVMLVAAGFAIGARPRRTRLGDAALALCREKAARAARAPMPGELALAFALAGPAVLAGTSAAPYGVLLRKLNDSGDGGGGDGGGDGGGGGCGGGGCGGCSS